MRGNKILERLTVKDSNTPHSCDYRYINTESVCELLDKLAALCLNIPITLILDNARYQKCNLVEEHAKKLGIQLLYLP